MNPDIERAFEAVPRNEFLPAEHQHIATLDRPIHIGYGQTNSQPSTVAAMLEWLEVEPGEHILDVGSGSGWTSALLGYLVGPQGSVVAVEIVPELVEFGRENCQRVGIENVSFYLASDNVFGRAEDAPYQRILVSATAESLPQELLAQLARGGKMVIPISNEILEIEKDDSDEVFINKHFGFAFVPLIG